jgi:hypothetical protein
MATRNKSLKSSEEFLAEKAQAIEVTIPVKERQGTRYNLDPVSFFVNDFLGRRPDGVVMNEAGGSFTFYNINSH